MNVLGIIPARGGSKAIPRKNIALVLGQPLLAYTCDAALASQRLTRVVLSTDGEDVDYSGLARASDDLLAVGVEARAVKVSVGVNEHEQ